MPEETALGVGARSEIFRRGKAGLDRDVLLIAMLDGAQSDDGTAWEIGYFFATKAADAKIIGIRTFVARVNRRRRSSSPSSGRATKVNTIPR